MKNAIALVVLILIGCQAPINQETISLEEEPILVGRIDWAGLTQNPYADWFIPGYKTYKVDSVALLKLTSSLEDVEIILFMGTWCEDSQVQVPQFYKILDKIHFNLEQLEVIGLEKQEDGLLISPQHEEASLDIGFVPTIIFTRNGKELGRITEYPQQSLEKDMVMFTQVPGAN